MFCYITIYDTIRCYMILNDIILDFLILYDAVAFHSMLFYCIQYSTINLLCRGSYEPRPPHPPPPPPSPTPLPHHLPHHPPPPSPAKEYLKYHAELAKSEDSIYKYLNFDQARLCMHGNILASTRGRHNFKYRFEKYLRYISMYIHLFEYDTRYSYTSDMGLKYLQLFTPARWLCKLLFAGLVASSIASATKRANVCESRASFVYPRGSK